MKLTLKEKGPIHILVVADKVDRAGVDSLALFFQGYAKRGLHDLVLDLSETQSLVSAAFGLILSQLDAFDKAGKRIVIFSPNEKVTTLLERMGVPESIPVFADRQQALDALAAAPGP